MFWLKTQQIFTVRRYHQSKKKQQQEVIVPDSGGSRQILSSNLSKYGSRRECITKMWYQLVTQSYGELADFGLTERPATSDGFTFRWAVAVRLLRGGHQLNATKRENSTFKKARKILTLAESGCWISHIKRNTNRPSITLGSKNIRFSVTDLDYPWLISSALFSFRENGNISPSKWKYSRKRCCSFLPKFMREWWEKWWENW